LNYSGYLTVINTINPSKSVDSYIHFANSISLLTEEEEFYCAENFKKNNDLYSAQRLIMSHLRFVIKVAKGFNGYGLQLSDLIQEGNIGLMKAVKRFNHKLGVRLVSFAVHWIKAEIHEFIIRNWKIVKIATTKAQRKLFFNLRNCKKHIGWFSQKEIQDVADTLKVKTTEVIEMEKRMNTYDQTFDLLQDYDQEFSYHLYPNQYLTTDDNDIVDIIHQENIKKIQKKSLKLALNCLDKRSKFIIKNRWLKNKKTTLHDLAKKYLVSAERIRQIELQALEILRQKITY